MLIIAALPRDAPESTVKYWPKDFRSETVWSVQRERRQCCADAGLRWAFMLFCFLHSGTVAGGIEACPTNQRLVIAVPTSISVIRFLYAEEDSGLACRRPYDNPKLDSKKLL